jgi:hypothetical protein
MIFLCHRQSNKKTIREIEKKMVPETPEAPTVVALNQRNPQNLVDDLNRDHWLPLATRKVNFYITLLLLGSINGSRESVCRAGNFTCAELATFGWRSLSHPFPVILNTSKEALV